VLESFERGERSAAKLIAAGRKFLEQEPDVRLDYFSVVDPESLEPVEHVACKSLVAVAAYVGPTRLIDNLVLRSQSPT